MRNNIIVLTLFLISVVTSFDQVHSLNILGVFPYEGKSHFFVFKTYLEELAHRGHNVTVISYFPRKKPLENYHDISLAGKVKILEDVFPLKRSYYTIFQISLFLFSSGTENCKTLLADENVQNLWKSKIKFDVVVVEQFNSDCALGLAYALNAPVVGVTSHTLTPWMYKRFGVPYNPSYVSFQLLEGGTKPTFYQRVERTIWDAYFNIGYKFMNQNVDQKTLAQYFDNIPPLEELARNIKFMLIYTNFMLIGSTLYPPNIVEVGGYHVAKPKPLSNELLKFIEESQHGVIFISFGSMLKAALTPKEKVDAIISALSELPQRVIWKWEEETLPGNPKNIYLSKWLPQNDILAHPKVLAFYSHCGLLGTTEAIYHGVPMVAMPIFGDQPSNAAAVEESGLGVQIQISELTKEKLLQKFKTILDPEWQERAKLLSRVWHDRPMTPLESAIYWIEYVARYNGTPNLVPPSTTVPCYQQLQLDVLAFVGLVFYILMYVLYKIISVCCCCCCQNQPQADAVEEEKRSRRVKFD